jgi:hypothetical protein
MANLTPEERIRLLKEQARIQAEINSGLDNYLDRLKDVKVLNKEISSLEKLIEEQRLKFLQSNDPIIQQNIDLLQRELDILKEKQSLLRVAFKDANVSNMLLAKGGALALKSFAKIPDILKSIHFNIKSLGLFEMDSAIKQSALSMGLMTTQSQNLRFDIKAAADETLAFGVGIQELAKYQSDYSEALGRSVLLGKEGLEAMGQMAKATALGAEGAASLAASLDKQGYSAERTRDFIEETVNESYKMGLNASKVVKNIQQNIKMLNKYKFKGGAEGLKKMAMTVTKLGIEMQSIAGMSEKLFDLEGAVDMSAQLQVMGGSWAKMADPFHLMYMARNDMEGLTQEIAKAAEASAKFNTKTQEFEISSLEMHRLRKIAEQTGIEYDTLADAALNARKQTEVRSQVRFDFDKETKDFLETTAKFDEQGQAYMEIDVNGQRVKKMIRDLTSSDQMNLKNMLAERKNLEKMAEDARTFDDALNNTIMLLKTRLLGGLEIMNEKIIPAIDNFVKRLKDEGWLDSITEMAKTIGGMLGTLAKFFIDNPILTAAIYGISKLGGIIFDAVTWIKNGVLLSRGFMMGMGGVSGILSSITNAPANIASSFAGGGFNMSGSQGFGSNLRSGFGSGGARLAGGAAALISGISEYSEQREKGKGVAESLGRGALEGAGSGLGAYGGGALGAAIGTAIAPGIGTAIGGAIGAIAGGLAGSYVSDLDTYSVNDGIFGANQTHKRGIIQGGTITAINNKDDLIAAKPNGIIHNAISNNSSSQDVRHSFGDLKVGGEIMLRMPGAGTVGVDLMRDPSFIRELTQKINIEIEKMRNQIQKG